MLAVFGIYVYHNYALLSPICKKVFFLYFDAIQRTFKSIFRILFEIRQRKILCFHTGTRFNVWHLHSMHFFCSSFVLKINDRRQRFLLPFRSMLRDVLRDV